VGTRGRRLLEGETEVKIHGQMVPVRAQIRQVTGFSAHADWHEMLRWMEGMKTAPKQTLLVHGEPSALSALSARLVAKGWPTYIPKHLEKVELAA
jgi:metallo-beta-lactamase family protein